MATNPPTEAIQESPEVELDLPGVGKIKAELPNGPAVSVAIWSGEYHGMSVDDDGFMY